MYFKLKFKFKIQIWILNPAPISYHCQVVNVWGLRKRRRLLSGCEWSGHLPNWVFLFCHVCHAWRTCSGFPVFKMRLILTMMRMMRMMLTMMTPVLELLPLAVVSGGQVWLGIENIKSKETANAVKQLPLKPAILNRVGSDWLGRFGLALKRPNHQNMLKNSEVITIFMQVTIFPTECSVISCCSNNVETYNYALWWAGSAW